MVQSYSPTRKTTRDRIQKILDENCKLANTEFNATYDGLTGLLNGRSLEEKIKDAFISAKSVNEQSQTEIKPTAAVALIALDLDHFKQVNDSYGHAYGDIVLKSFAHRLEDKVLTIKKECGDLLQLEVGRSGGEEFLVIVSGDLLPAKAKEIADQIRAAISDQELPTNEEWQIFHGCSVPGLSLPHITERKITTSVGLSSLKPRSKDNLFKTVSELRRESDAALYRAKAGGRNTVRYFPEIRDRFATVIEHHEETDVVAVDIGSQVNVRIGQEFHVFHPDFTGVKGFFSSDGRSKKRLGTYPRFSSGRLVVFEVQNDISFCTIAERKLKRFPAGSTLEQIPLGSIFHLVSAETRASGVTAAQMNELDVYIEKIVEDSSRPFACVFSLRNMSTVEKARGTAFVNQALATLFEEIRKIFPLPAKICQIELDKIAVAAQLEKKTDWKVIVEKVITSASSKMSQLVEFTAGVSEFSEKRPAEKGNHTVLDRKKALSYARYSAVALMDSEKKIDLFSHSTATRIIASHRRKKTYEDALADYQALHTLGIESSIFENQAALCALESDKEDFAIVHMQRAIALEQEEPIFKANLAYIQFEFNRIQEAHETFTRLRSDHPEFELDPVYLGPEALAAYAAGKKNLSAVNHASLQKKLETAFSLAESGKIQMKNRIALALADVKTWTTPESAFEEPTVSLEQIWSALVDAVGKASPFVRAYFVEAHPVSFENAVFTIGFDPEFADHIPLVDNSRNQNLLVIKLREMGHEVNEFKFIQHSSGVFNTNSR